MLFWLTFIAGGKLKISTGTKMKAVLWTKIAPTQISNTFWKNVYEKPDIEDKIRAEIDLDELCNKFRLPSPKPTNTSPPKSAASQVKSPTHVSVLDSKRNNNICMLENITNYLIYKILFFKFPFYICIILC